MPSKIERTMEARAQQAREAEREIAEQFDDPIARETGWTRLHGGGANFRARKLAGDSSGRIRVVNTPRSLMLPLGFGIAGIFLMMYATVDFFTQSPQLPESETLTFSGFMLLLFVGVFLMLPAFITLRPKDRLTFDKPSGRFWRGRPPQSMEDSADAHRLERIVGLQILPKYIQRGSQDAGRSYWSYELNLILDDHGRMLVMDHGDLNATREDAERLSRFLGVPVFEAKR